MGLETTSDIEEIRDRNGSIARPASDEELNRVANEVVGVAEEVLGVTDKLGNFPNGIDGEATDDTTGSTLPSNAVPEGIEVVVQAKRTNEEPIAVGLTDSPTVTLVGGESVEYRVQNTSQIRISSTFDGDGVNFTVEAE